MLEIVRCVTAFAHSCLQQYPAVSTHDRAGHMANLNLNRKFHIDIHSWKLAITRRSWSKADALLFWFVVTLTDTWQTWQIVISWSMHVTRCSVLEEVALVKKTWQAYNKIYMVSIHVYVCVRHEYMWAHINAFEWPSDMSRYVNKLIISLNRLIMGLVPVICHRHICIT